MKLKFQAAVALILLEHFDIRSSEDLYEAASELQKLATMLKHRAESVRADHES